MAFCLRWSSHAEAQYRVITDAAQSAFATRQKSGKTKASKQEGLFGQVTKALRLLAQNPRHRSLQTHEYLSIANPYETNGKVFTAYAQQKTPRAYRIFWCYGPEKGQMTILAISPHP